MKKKILFVNDEMVVGGVAKVLNNLLMKFDSQQYELDLLVLHKHGDMLNDVPDSVNVLEGTPFFEVCDLSLKQCLSSFNPVWIFRKIYLIYLLKTGRIENKIIKERKKMNLSSYDVEIAFKEGFCSVFTGFGNSQKKVNWIHVDYKVMNYSANYMTTLKKVLRLFDAHVAVSEVAARSYEEVFNLEKEVKVIHNIIQDESILSKSMEKVDFKSQPFAFLSVGRLHPQKAYDRFVRCHKRLIDLGYDIHSYIVGDGELKESLEFLIQQNKVDDSFILCGNQSNPYPYIKQADCFVLSSLYEGLPTVVFESLICHVPVLACEVAGVKEQLQNKYGIVVNNEEEALFEGMKILLDNQEKLKELKQNCSQYSYDNDKIIAQVELLLEDE